MFFLGQRDCSDGAFTTTSVYVVSIADHVPYVFSASEGYLAVDSTNPPTISEADSVVTIGVPSSEFIEKNGGIPMTVIKVDDPD